MSSEHYAGNRLVEAKGESNNHKIQGLTYISNSALHGSLLVLF